MKRLLAWLTVVALVAGLCPVLTATAAVSGDFEYEVLADNTAKITDYTGTATTLEIPAVLDGWQVSTIGTTAFGNCTTLQSVTIPDSVTAMEFGTFAGCTALESVVLPDGLTAVEQSTFTGCTALQNVTIPNGVTTIRDYAFTGCTSLQSITIPNGVNSIMEGAFSHCTALANVVIPDSVTMIDGGAFEGCTALTSIVIPDSVTFIGSMAFIGCTSLASIKLPDGEIAMCKDTFYNTAYYNNAGRWEKDVLYIGNHLLAAKTSLSGEYRIENGTKTISARAFDFCDTLTNVIIPDSVIAIGWGAFRYNPALTSITIPDSVTVVPNHTFYQCTALGDVYYGGDEAAWKTMTIGEGNEPLTAATIHYVEGDYEYRLLEDHTAQIVDYTGSAIDLVIPSTLNGYTVTSIKYDAFFGCTSLQHVVIPDSVTSIGEWAFGRCSSLQSVVLPDGLTTLETAVFSGCTSLETMTIPDSVTSIKNKAFFQCTSLTNITIPDSVTSLGVHTFYECTSLQSVVIPDGVTSIGFELFYGCTALESITIPDSMIEIESYAFDGCTALDDVYYGGDEAAWKAIVIGGNNEPLSAATIHYTGDLNGDGKRNISDATYLFAAASGRRVLTETQKAVSDISGDGKITVHDALLLYVWIAGYWQP